MSEGQAASGPEPQEAETGAAPARVRAAGDPGALLLAVERVGADVAALRRAVASQPEEVAARLDVDAATAAIGVRVGALGSALDQLRLSMLAALDRSAERVDAPAWLPDLRAILADTRARIDSPGWLPDLRAALSDLAPLAAEHERQREAVAQLAAVERTMAERPGLEPVLEATAGLADGERLHQLHAAIFGVAQDRSNLDDIVAAVRAVDLGERLARVEHAVAELADGVRAGAAVGDALEDVGERLASIEDAAGRVADDAHLLVERVAPVPDRLSAIASQVDRITPLARAGDQAGSLFDRLDHVGGTLVEVLALLRAKGATAGEDVDERFEGVVDVLAGVTRRQDQLTAAIASILDQLRGPDDETVRAFEAVAAMVEQQEQALALRLDQIDGELQRMREATTAFNADDEGLAFRTVLERMDRQQQTLATHLDWVGERLSEVAAHLVPDATTWEDERFEAVVEQLAAVARRQDDLAATFAGVAGSPVAIAAVFDRMEQRERSLAARLDRIDAELRRVAQGAPAGAASSAAAGAPRGGAKGRAGGSLDASVESIATITGDLARLIESTAERLDRRLARVESSLGDAPGGAATPARPTTSPEAAALRLAELRAERAQVQARLQEERLLAARSWEEDS